MKSVSIQDSEASDGEETKNVVITDYELEKQMKMVVDIGAIKDNLGEQVDGMVSELMDKLKEISFKKKLVTGTSAVEQELNQSLRLAFYYNCQRLAVHFPPSFI